MPFLADELYQNLVRSVDQSAPGVGAFILEAKFDEALIDEAAQSRNGKLS